MARSQKRPIARRNSNTSRSKRKITWTGTQTPVSRYNPIEWVDPQTGPITHQHVRAPRYMRSGEPEEGVANSLVVGGTVIAKYDMESNQWAGDYPMTSLELCYPIPPNVAPVPRGSLLMYTGEIRVTERIRVNGKDSETRVIKHTFVTPVGRCIIHDLTYVTVVPES